MSVIFAKASLCADCKPVCNSVRTALRFIRILFIPAAFLCILIQSVNEPQMYVGFISHSTKHNHIFAIAHATQVYAHKCALAKSTAQNEVYSL